MAKATRVFNTPRTRTSRNLQPPAAKADPVLALAAQLRHVALAHHRALDDDNNIEDSIGNQFFE